MGRGVPLDADVAMAEAEPLPPKKGDNLERVSRLS